MDKIIENLRPELLDLARESKKDPVRGTHKLMGYVENYPEEELLALYQECIEEVEQEQQAAA